MKCSTMTLNLKSFCNICFQKDIIVVSPSLCLFLSLKSQNKTFCAKAKETSFNGRLSILKRLINFNLFVLLMKNPIEYSYTNRKSKISTEDEVMNK